MDLPFASVCLFGSEVQRGGPRTAKDNARCSCADGNLSVSSAFSSLFFRFLPSPFRSSMEIVSLSCLIERASAANEKNKLHDGSRRREREREREGGQASLPNSKLASAESIALALSRRMSVRSRRTSPVPVSVPKASWARRRSRRNEKKKKKRVQSSPEIKKFNENLREKKAKKKNNSDYKKKRCTSIHV